MNSIKHFISAILLGSSMLLGQVVLAAEADGRIDGNNFRLYYKSTVNPLPLYRIHGWIIHIDTLDGVPVNGASVTVYGGMPAHRHGLPTRPRVIETGDGHYFMQGLKFSMTGEWEVWFDVRVGDKTDKFKIDLTL